MVSVSGNDTFNLSDKNQLTQNVYMYVISEDYVTSQVK